MDQWASPMPSPSWTPLPSPAGSTGQRVDLVMADAVRNPDVRADIDASKQLIDEA